MIQLPEWTMEKPTKIGLYLFRNALGKAHELYVVNRADGGLKASVFNVEDMPAGYWLGPIPRSPEGTGRQHEFGKVYQL